MESIQGSSIMAWL